MVAETDWYRHGMKLRRCHPVYICLHCCQSANRVQVACSCRSQMHAVHRVFNLQPTLHVVGQSVTADRRHCMHVSICTDFQKNSPPSWLQFFTSRFFMLNRFRLYLAEILATHYA